MLKKTALAFVLFVTLFATAHASENDITITNASDTVVNLSCTNCSDCSPVMVMPMGRLVLDCVPSNVEDAFTIQYIYTKSNRETMEGKINLSLGQNLSIDNINNGEDSLEFLITSF